MQLPKQSLFPSFTKVTTAWKPIKNSFHSFRELFGQGGVEVETPFVLDDKQLAFRTFLQADADVLQFFPPIPINNPEALSVYRRSYQAHIEKLSATLLSLSFGSRLITGFSDLALVTLNFFFVLRMFLVDGFAALYYVAMVVTFSVAYRFFLQKKVVGWVFGYFLRRFIK